ncbi:16S rRNA (cytosine(967)-C(5))-methyltransferase RsmB [Lactobacillus sp. PV034]|uniref:16S rRNA (cytosine(967)-C(5))-methyltransferase RsmB n=1 Tax=Lactobacillus sp. PV034 TaxID=2594495 RepID=UPI0022406A46|nr:16S rRNA (cytosine(967)-C(5))-methyltransferase RsmB [Lactobacillus sp. PV034]QNQ80270.1 16S rRNA (cytosine(967)-C(5))-methyltransferase RsmB [Lactobacillus sp. PV034]
MTSARSVALDTLIKVLNQNSYSNIALNHALAKSNLSDKDKALVTKIVYGTIQYKIFLDYQLKPLIKTKLKDKYLYPLLLMSAYQYFFLERIPTNAIFDEANKLAKKYGKKNSGSFRLVNGILRSLERQGKLLPPKSDIKKYLSVKYSFPEWLVNYFITTFGQERAASILKASNVPASTSIRITAEDLSPAQVQEQLNAAGIKSVPSKLTDHNLIIEHGNVADTELFKAGKITIQDSAASLAVDAFDFSGDEEVLDACSAPGGKTVQIAEHLTTGHVIALDIHQNKLTLVQKAAQRLKVSDKIETKTLDARKAGEVFAKGQFNKILVDAPCSGLGLIRRKPEIRYGKSLKDIQSLSKIQRAILTQLAPLLAPEGELVYSTCTITKEEDEDVVGDFLKHHPEFELVPIQVGNLPKQDFVKILPDEFNSDGFFIAKFKKRG